MVRRTLTGRRERLRHSGGHGGGCAAPEPGHRLVKVIVRDKGRADRVAVKLAAVEHILRLLRILRCQFPATKYLYWPCI